MRLPTDKQIKRVIALMRAEGFPIARVDILDSGVSVSTIADQPRAANEAGAGSAYDDWKKQDHDRAAPRQNAA